MSNSSILNADLRKPLNKYNSATRPRTDMPESGDCEGMSIPVESKRSSVSNMHLKLSNVSDWLLERPLCVDSEFSSYHGAAKKKTTPRGCALRVAKPFIAYPEADFFVEDQLPFDQPRHFPDPFRYPNSSISCPPVLHLTRLSSKITVTVSMVFPSENWS